MALDLFFEKFETSLIHLLTFSDIADT